MPHRHALIVGGARGLGRVVAEAFAGAGWRVSVIDRAAPDEALPPGADFLLADIRDRDARARALAAALDAAGPVAALVFAQRFRGAGDGWAGEMDTSVTATREIVEALADRFAAGGAVVMIGSAAGAYVAVEQPASYHAAKGALRQLARFYAVTLGRRGVRCNVVSPAIFVRGEASGAEGERAARRAAVFPLGRVPTDLEIARVVLYLAGPDASCINGQDIAVDGGLSALAHASLAGGPAAPA